LVSQAIIDLMEARSNAAGAALFEHRYTEETNRRRRAIYAGTIEMRTNMVRRLFQTRHAPAGTLHSPENSVYSPVGISGILILRLTGAGLTEAAKCLRVNSFRELNSGAGAGRFGKDRLIGWMGLRTG